MKLRNILTFALVFGLLSMGSGASAKQTREFNLPANAKQVAQNVYYLGQKKDPKTGNMVDGLAIVHYRNSNAKPSGVGNKPSKTTCYAYLANGAKWKTLENWVVDPTNNSGLDPAFILSNLSGNISKWEAAATYNILGQGDIVSGPLSSDSSIPDGQNEVLFADITSSNAIAVTTVWGYFYGPTVSRELIEWDMVFDDVTYDWSSNGDAGKMDFENIATHELGHAVGLADLYNGACADETMYGYANYGETNKQTLENGDKTGIRNLYK